MKENRIYSLDILRIIGAAMIVLHHYQQITNSYFGGKFDFWRYNVVVELFFFLSGFLAWKYTMNKQVGFWQFIKKKAIRLLPLVMISSVAYEILLFIYVNVCKNEWILGNNISIRGVILNSLGLQCGWFFENPGVNNPTWYVSVLLLCFTIYWMIDALSRKIKIPNSLFFVMMVVLGIVIWWEGWNMPFLNPYAARGYYSFFWGLLMGKLIAQREINMKWTLVIVAVLLGLHWGVDWLGLVHRGVYNYVLVLICYPLLVFLCISEPVKRIFNFRILGVLGEATYDVYVWHVPLLLAMYVGFEVFHISLNLDYYKCVFAFLGGAFGVGVVSFFLINRPLQKLLIKP